MRPRLSTRIELEPRYSLLTVAYLVAIYWSSSRPDLGAPDGPLLRLVMNLGHAPLFAGLAFCVVKSLRRVGESSARYALAFAVVGACAALDEWHQFFVPGRSASISDLALDLAGIFGMFLILRLHTRFKEAARNMSAATVPTPGPATPPMGLPR
jgi:VanZ family protein